MPNIWGFDFGAVTGVSLGFYGPNTGYMLLKTWHVQNGCQGFIDWWRDEENLDSFISILDVVVAEKFIPSPGNDFTANLDGVPIEGVLMALSPVPIHWQTRAQKQKAGFYDRILKEHGLWQSGSNVNWGDGRDANDSIIHPMEWLRINTHMPTLRKYFKEG